MTGRDCWEYVEDLARYMNFALQFTEDMDFDEFANDPKTVIAVTKCIEVVGEATKHIPDGSSLNQVGRLNCNFPSLRYIISMRFFVVLKPLALLFAD